MNQLRKAKSRNPRRHAVLPRKYIKVVVTYVLLFAIVFSNMSNPLLNVFAGQKKEEFRIHADELQRAAEEALEEGNIVEEPLDFYTKDSSLLKEYEELFAADGTLYEIFPDYEREYYLDDIELRIFLRISPDADPDSYALTGDRTAPAMNGIMIKCHTHKCTRVVTLKNFTEGQIVERTDALGKCYL